MAVTVLDARGLKCPLPVLRANKMLKTLQIGDVLRVEATDVAAPKDFQVFCETTGARLLSSTQEADVFVIEIEKTG